LPGLPVVSGKTPVKFLGGLGYQVVRRRGSHVQIMCVTPAGNHTITVPLHKEIAKGTLNDILTRVSLWKGIPKDELIRHLTK
jgi:predicted RNA binding protein YcfA (HicA-like mRNA interferase family)